MLLLLPHVLTQILGSRNYTLFYTSSPVRSQAVSTLNKNRVPIWEPYQLSMNEFKRLIAQLRDLPQEGQARQPHLNALGR